MHVYVIVCALMMRRLKYKSSYMGVENSEDLIYC